MSGAKEIYEKMHGIENYDGPGMYWIDHDIPSGAYRIESKSGGSYSLCNCAVGSMASAFEEEYQDSCTVDCSSGFVTFKGDKISPYKKTTNE